MESSFYWLCGLIAVLAAILAVTPDRPDWPRSFPVDGAGNRRRI